MVFWTLMGGLYLMVAGLGLFASQMERRANPAKQHLVVRLAGYACCLLWPATLVGMALAIVAGPRIMQIWQKPQNASDFKAFPADLHVKA